MSKKAKAKKAVRLVPIPKPERELSEKELANAFAFVSPDAEMLWLGVNQVLGDFLFQTDVQVTHPDLSERPGLLAHTAGGREWLKFAQGRMQELREGTKQKLKSE